MPQQPGLEWLGLKTNRQPFASDRDAARLDRRGAQCLGRHLVSATPDATPRALKLVAKNVQHAERLIEQGHMQPAGLVHVDAARSDGRWATAYAGSATMVMPEVF